MSYNILYILGPTPVFVDILQHFLDKMKYDVIGVWDHFSVFRSGYLDHGFYLQCVTTV
jgi:hypothetical protein